MNNASLKMAKKHVGIIEENLKMVCERFSIPPDKLFIEYLPDDSIQILIKACHFKIINEFLFKKEEDFIK